MKVIYVDDERSAHINFYYDLKDKMEIDHVEFFYTADDALAYVKDNYVDLAFLDMDLAGELDGVKLGKQIRDIKPNIEIAFVTGHDEFAREAFRVGGRAYLTKPYTKDELDDTIDIMRKLTQAHHNDNSTQSRYQEDVFIKTFGNFDVFLKNKPLKCKNAKAKELLAFLVDQRGGTVNNAQVFMALWENQEYTNSTSTYVRRTVRALREELECYGIGDIFVSNRNCYCIDVNRFVCDFYKLMDEDELMVDRYNGEYMTQYYWGETTIPLIERKIIKINKKKFK